eukprot:gnl/TRDRNA2_/TRDRNA2_183325_c0_seq1.p1 gnl/TRDRNA2_/TRDRNA2_183325_c0~~gnl/TRDRNA2_/TRDRNA2_183325_c0_seq1.p1  ORF type:complete len:708 (-),score=74.56 gnl/TRDRNA2_/TRDRNA2_183325_c0_seq1:237-2360(-)
MRGCSWVKNLHWQLPSRAHALPVAILLAAATFAALRDFAAEERSASIEREVLRSFGMSGDALEEFFTALPPAGASGPALVQTTSHRAKELRSNSKVLVDEDDAFGSSKVGQARLPAHATGKGLHPRQLVADSGDMATSSHAATPMHTGARRARHPGSSSHFHGGTSIHVPSTSGDIHRGAGWTRERGPAVHERTSEGQERFKQSVLPPAPSTPDNASPGRYRRSSSETHMVAKDDGSPSLLSDEGVDNEMAGEDTPEPPAPDDEDATPGQYRRSSLGTYIVATNDRPALDKGLEDSRADEDTSGGSGRSADPPIPGDEDDATPGRYRRSSLETHIVATDGREPRSPSEKGLDDGRADEDTSQSLGQSDHPPARGDEVDPTGEDLDVKAADGLHLLLPEMGPYLNYGLAALGFSTRHETGSTVFLVMALVLILLALAAACAYSFLTPTKSRRTQEPASWTVPSGRGTLRSPMSRYAATPSFQPMPTPTSRASPSPRTSFDMYKPDADQFCPDLIVPPMNECILVIPLSAVSLPTFIVSDIAGSPVLRVESSFEIASGREPSLPRGLQSASSVKQLLVTTAAGYVLARCRPAPVPTGMPDTRSKPAFQLLRARGEYFAQITHADDQERFVLETLNGARVHFCSAGTSFEDHAVNITDDKGDLLASTDLCTADFDPMGEYYRLRVAPNTDVGLVLCGLLCLEHMGGAASL